MMTFKDFIERIDNGTDKTKIIKIVEGNKLKNACVRIDPTMIMLYDDALTPLTVDKFISKCMSHMDVLNKEITILDKMNEKSVAMLNNTDYISFIPVK